MSSTNKQISAAVSLPRPELRNLQTLRAYQHNARTHSKRQMEQIARSIERFGFLNPVLIDASGASITAHGRVAAAKRLGLTQVPTLRIEHFSAAEKRAYILADNKLAEKAGWDREIQRRALSRPVQRTGSIMSHALVGGLHRANPVAHNRPR
jgi:ParB-like chromosome segregation protein Spo0J